MKNLIKFLFLITLFFSVGCVHDIEYHETKLKELKEAEKNKSNRIEFNLPHNVKIIEIDSCEYILRDGSSDNQSLAHKGNCKYCAERNKTITNE